MGETMLCWGGVGCVAVFVVEVRGSIPFLRYTFFTPCMLRLAVKSVHASHTESYMLHHPKRTKNLGILHFFSFVSSIVVLESTDLMQLI
jgi:hypothetical protein